MNNKLNEYSLERSQKRFEKMWGTHIQLKTTMLIITIKKNYYD